MRSSTRSSRRSSPTCRWPNHSKTSSFAAYRASRSMHSARSSRRRICEGGRSASERDAEDVAELERRLTVGIDIGEAHAERDRLAVAPRPPEPVDEQAVERSVREDELTL